MTVVLNFITSIILGLIPEVLFLTMYLVFTKNINKNEFLLGFLISIAYIICIMISRFKILYYVMFIAIVYIILRTLYRDKTEIIDMFIISLAMIYVTIISFVCSIFISDNYILYYALFILNRILLFLPILVLRNKLNLWYLKYCSLWNRNYEKKQPIKSITLRNISLIILNVFIFLLNILTLYVINTFGVR